MTIDLDNFKQIICHEVGEGEEHAETSEIEAYFLDEQTGIGCSLGFPNNMLSKADYLHINEEQNQFIIIEASDLREDLNDCHLKLKELEEEAFAEYLIEKPKAKKLPKSIFKGLRTKAFYGPKAEMMQKWCGSIAIIERLCRRNNLTATPKYS